MPAPARHRLARLLTVAVAAAGLLASTAAPALAASDVTPPTLQSVELLSPSTVTAGDTVTVGWQASDDVAVMQVQVSLRDAAGKDHVVYANAPATTGSTTVTSSWANGPVVAAWVWVYDVNGNFAVYYRDGTLSRSGDGGHATTHTVALSAVEFSTEGIAADLTPPTLAGIALATPGPFTRGDSVALDVDARDDVGVSYLNVVLVDGAGKIHSLQASGDPDQITRVIDDTWADGPVSLMQVVVDDTAHNSVVYDSDGSITYSAGVSGPASHSLDFGAVAFSTHDVGGDVTPPVLTSVTLETPGPLVEGDEVRLTADASDASGVAQVALVLMDAANKSHTLFALSGAGSLTATIDTSWAVGEVRIGQVRLYDSKQNEAHYNPSGELRTVPPGATSHGVDLTSQVFRVEGRPTVEVTSAPASSSRSSTAAFGFATSDRDTDAQDLSAECTVDGGARACSPSGGTFSSLATGGHRLDVRIVDPQGHSSTTSYAWRVDTAAPTATTTGPGRFPLTSLPTLSWTGSDSGSGVASYDVRSTTATVGSGFSGWVQPTAWQGLTTTSRTASLPRGTTLCFEVRAHDHAGNVGGWSAMRCATNAIDELTLNRAGPWAKVYSASLVGSYGLRSTSLGAEVLSPYTTVRRVGVVVSTCPTCGTVGVYVGGTYVGKLSLTSSTLRHRQVRALALPSARIGVVSLRVLTSGKPVLLDGVLLSRV